MPPIRQKNGIPSRRRREDDGEEEESFLGEVDDDSVSEGSVISPGDEDADGEGSDASGEDDESRPSPKTKEQAVVAKSSRIAQNGTASKSAFKPSTEAEVMLNGLKISATNDQPDEIHFEDMAAADGPLAESIVEGQNGASKQDTAADKSRLEHQEYLRQRDTNPAFVPNRGGFFLHDDRSAPAHPNNFRAFGRGRGRGLQINGNQLG